MVESVQSEEADDLAAGRSRGGEAARLQCEASAELQFASVLAGWMATEKTLPVNCKIRLMDHIERAIDYLHRAEVSTAAGA